MGERIREKTRRRRTVEWFPEVMTTASAITTDKDPLLLAYLTQLHYIHVYNLLCLHF